MNEWDEGEVERVTLYVDGFNLYFGLRSRKLQRYLWLNLHTLGTSLLNPRQQLLQIKYFTARVSGPPDKRARQSTFIEALETLPNLSIYYGKFQVNPATCLCCGATTGVPNEKQTDVNIAVEMLCDGFGDHYDTAILLSADSDLTAPIRAIRQTFPAKRVVVAFPPGRYSADLKAIAHGSFTIGRAKLAHSQFPDKVVKADGYTVVRPEKWSPAQI